jgi:hypothetical protein
MTAEEREEFERDLREEARMESLQEMQHENAMCSDVDYASQHLQSNLSADWINTYKYLKKECYRYNVDFQELLENL